MKHIYLFAICSLLPFCGYAQLEEEGFEIWPPPGWTIMDNGVGIGQSWSQSNALPAQPAYDGTYAAYLNRENVDTGTLAEDYLITPEFTMPQDAELRFFSRLTQIEDQGSIYKVLIINPTLQDDSELENYTTLQTWTELEINPNQLDYNEIQIAIPAEWYGQQVKLAFIMSGDEYDRWLIDNVKVASLCADPFNLITVTAGIDFVTLSWNNPSWANEWEIELLPEGDPFNGSGAVYTGQLPYSVNVVPGCYKYKVRALCEDGGNSEWIGPETVCTVEEGDNCTAPIPVTTLPFFTSDDTANYGSEYSGFPGTGCGNFGLQDNLSGNDVVYAFTPDFTGTVNIRLTDTDYHTGMFVYTECDDIGLNCLTGQTNSIDDFTATNLPININDLEVIENQTYIIVISTRYGTTPYDLAIQRTSCDAPTNLSVAQGAVSEVWLSWYDTVEAASWEVSVQVAGMGMPMGAGEYTTTINDSFPIPASENLQPLTTYEFWVRAACDDGSFGDWSVAHTFETSFCTGTTCSYTFDMWHSDDSPWSGNSISIVQDGTVTATLTGTSEWFQGHVYQDVVVCDGLSFEIFWNEGGDVPHGVGFELKNSFGQIVYTKPPSVGEQNTSLYTSGQIYCGVPECQPPSIFSSSGITQSSANISWEDAYGENWEYYVIESGQPEPDATTTDGVVLTTTNSAALADLNPATNYEIYVRNICDEGSAAQSEWSSATNFSTDSCLQEDKCDYVFTMSTFSNFGGWAGGEMSIYQNGIFVTGIGDTFTSGLSQDITIPLCHGIPFEIVWASGTNVAMGLQVHNSFGQLIYNIPPQYGNLLLGTIIYDNIAPLDCFNPACIVPVNLTADNATNLSIDLQWQGAVGGSWQYYITEAGNPAPDDTVEGIDSATNNITAILPTPATYYEYYVREHCDASDSGFTAWAGPVQFFSTLCNEEDKCIFYVELKSASGVSYQGNTMTIYQGGVPAATVGPTFDYLSPDLYHHIVQVPLCPDIDIELFWNDISGSDTDLGITINSPYLEIIYDLPAGTGTGLQGTSLYSGPVSCGPPVCIKPQNLTAVNEFPETATLGWEEIGSATSWDICVLPYNSLELPTPDINVSEYPYVYGGGDEILLPSAPYKFYVRSVCDGTVSSWSGPYNFATPSINNDCVGAITIPVNTGIDCVDSIIGTITGASGSGVQTSCTANLLPDRDVWFKFTATAQTHVFTAYDFTGILVGFSVYSGDECGGMESLGCLMLSDPNQQDLKISGLVPGQDYYILVFNAGFYNQDFTSFELCIKTPVSIITDNTTYTVEQLVEQVLIPSPCIGISNVSWNTGTDFGLSNGIAYFSKGNSNFPIEEGLVLMTGNAMDAPGPNIGWPLAGGPWPLDQDLTDFVAGNYLDEAFAFTLYGPDFFDATLIEFDFVPTTDRIKFPVIFASEAYGGSQNSSYDVFAILLTTDDGTGPITTNLALVPGTNDPIGVATIKNSSYGSIYMPGDSSNEAYFEGYYGTAYLLAAPELVQSPYDTPINFNGNTTEILAQSNLVPGQAYHMKIVVADRENGFYGNDCAVFIGPFSAGIVDLGEDMAISSNTAICPGQESVIHSGLDSGDYTFKWFKNNEEIEGATGPDLVVTEPGIYSIDAAFSENCHATDTILVEFYENIVQPENLTECSATAFATFDLNEVTTSIQEATTAPQNLVISYHLSEIDAINQEYPLEISYTNVNEAFQTIFVRVENTITGCLVIEAFDLIVLDLIPQFNINDDFSICAGTEGTIQVEAINFDVEAVEYAWTHNGTAIAGNSHSLIASDAGVYGVTITNTGCSASAEVTITVLEVPVAVAFEDITVCGSYIFPQLPEGSSYYTISGGTGTQYNAGDIITEGQTIFVFAQTGTVPNCVSEDDYIITVNEQMVPVTGFNLPPTMCIAGPDIGPTLTDGFTAGGVFSAGEGLSINPVTGVIDLSESIPGNYSITYAFTEDTSNCIAAGSTVTEIEISPAIIPVTGFRFEDVYCGGIGIAAPDLFENFTPGGSFTGADGLVIDQATGEIDIAASEPGDYIVTYTIQPNLDNCLIGGTSSYDVAIDQNLSFVIEQYCEGNKYIVRAAVTEGTFGLVAFEWMTAEGILIGTDDEIFNVTDYAASVGGDVFPLELMLTVISNGCEHNEIVVVEDILCEIPRGISPNNDGMNDRLDLTGFDVSKISIFNRYGMEVYSRSNYSNQWHGQSNQGDDLPTGTYFYMVERTNGDSFTGWIYVNRELN